MTLTPTRELEIPKRQADLINALEELEKSIEILESRLSKVTSNPQPEETMKNPMANPVICELADFLMGRTIQATRINARVNTLLNRLEL